MAEKLMTNNYQRRSSRPDNKPSGFTLIELVVTIAIVAILSSIAVPSLQETIRRNRIDTEAQRIFISLNKARNNALTTNSPSFLCRATDGQLALTGQIACRTGAGLGALDWNADLLVYSVIPGINLLPPNNRFRNQRIQNLATGGGANAVRRQMLQNVSEAPSENIVSTANRNDFVLRFNPDGALQNAAPFRIGVCDNEDNSEIYGKLIEINAAGQIRLLAVDINNAARNCTPNNDI